MGLLQVQGLVKAFGSVRAVDAVSFEVRPGEIYGLLGPNGAGKTTTISMISGLTEADAGEVRVGGELFGADPQRAKGMMGVVPQDLAIYEELTGRENLEFWGRLAGLGAAEARGRAAELLTALSLSDRAADAVKTYSGGMKRRINLGCALLHRPRLLLLDEPTVGIDPQARLNILEFIRGLRASGTGMLYTTHYLEEAETLCDRIAIIDRGSVVACDTTAALVGRIDAKTLSIALAEPVVALSPALVAMGLTLAAPDRLVYHYRPSATSLAPILAAIQAHGFVIRDIISEETDLEAIFLQLTGSVGRHGP